MQLRYVSVLLRWAGRDRRAVAAQSDANTEARDIPAPPSQRSAAGPASLAEFYDAHAARAYGLAIRILCGDRGMAEDIVIETFVAVWKSRPPPGEGETADLEPALLRQVRKRCIEILRGRQDGGYWAGAGDLSPYGASIVARDGDTPTPAAIREHLAALPLDQHEAIERAFYQGQRSEQIAKEMGTSKESVHWAMRRGLRTLADGLSSARTPASLAESFEGRKRSAL